MIVLSLAENFSLSFTCHHEPARLWGSFFYKNTLYNFTVITVIITDGSLVAILLVIPHAPRVGDIKR